MDGRCRRSAVFRLSSAVAAEVEEAERAVAQASQRAEQVQKKREDFLGFCTTKSEQNSDFGVRNAQTDRSRRVVHDTLYYSDFFVDSFQLRADNLSLFFIIVLNNCLNHTLID